MPQLHHRSCHLCEAMCGIVIETEGMHITTIRGDERDPWSKGYICPKGVALQDIHHDPDRLRHPVRRTARGWQRISWAEAIDTVADNIVRIQRQHGDDALGIYWGNPPTHAHGLILTMLPFFMALRTRNRFSAASVDQLPQYLTSTLLYGNQVMFPIADIDRTDFWLIIGGNPLVSNGSISAAPDMRGRIQAIKARGGRVVVVDPRRSETARVAGEHHFIRPGRDVLLLLALLNVLFAEQRITLGHVGAFADNLAAVRAAVQPYTPQLVAPHVGMAADAIAQLARDFAAARSAVCYGRLGACQNPFGTLCHWLINLLNIVTGNLDRPGGAMFTQPAFDLKLVARLITGGGHYGRHRSRVRGLPEFSDELPSAALLEEIVTPGAGQIRALLLLAGNPVLTTPDGGRLDRALADLAFCAAIDFYINESTRHADVILPPTSPLEHGNYELAVSGVAVRNIARWSPPVFAPPADGMDDWQIVAALWARIWQKRGGIGRLAGPLLRRALNVLTPDRMLDIGLRSGHYGALRGGRPGLTLRRLRQTPHTLDLGPLTSLLPDALHTPHKRIDLAPALLRDDLARVWSTFFGPHAAPPAELLLIGRRTLRSNNSWMHNSARLVRGSNRCTLLMHPADAAARGLRDGMAVTIASAVGRVTAELAISDEVMAGVVSLPHGWGHAKAATGRRVAEAHPGVSVNDLTDPALIDALSGNAAVNGVPVTVTAAPAHGDNQAIFD